MTTTPLQLDAESVLAYVRGATLDGVRGVYDGGGRVEPVAQLFFAGKVRMEPYRSGPLATWMEMLRSTAARLKAVACAVMVGSEEGVLVALEHRELARDVHWWAPLSKAADAGRLVLGPWEERMGQDGGAGAWSVIRGGAPRGARA